MGHDPLHYQTHDTHLKQENRLKFGSSHEMSEGETGDMVKEASEARGEKRHMLLRLSLFCKLGQRNKGL
jgi:hypothetical protein